MSRRLNQFKRSQLIAFNNIGYVSIIDVERLAALAEATGGVVAGSDAS